MAASLTEKLMLEILADNRQLKRALKDSQKATDDTTKAIEKDWKNTDKVIDRTSQQISKSMANSTRNLTFQLQDVTTSLLSGASPFMVMSQQASQAGVAIQDLAKSGGLLKGIGASLAGMLSPATLGVGASILAFGYLMQAAEGYFNEAEEGGEEAKKAMEEQRKLIHSVASEYATSMPQLKAWNDQVERAAEAEKKRKAAAAGVSEAQARSAEAMAAVNAQMENAVALFNKTPKMKEKLAPVIEAWETLKRKIADQTATLTDVERFQALFNATVAKLPNQKIRDFAAIFENSVVPALTAAVTAMSNLVQEAKGLDNLDSKLESLTSLREARRDANIRDRDIANGPSTGYLQSRAVSTKIRAAITKFDGDFADSLAELLKEFPSIKVVSAFRSFEEQRRIYDSGVRPAAKPGTSLHEKGLAADLNFGGMSADEIRRVQSRARDFGLNFPLPGTDAGHVQSMRPRMEAEQQAADKATESLRNQREQYDQLLASINAKTEAATRENVVNTDLSKSESDRTALIEQARIVEELNTAAKAAGLVVDQQLIDKHNEIAAAMVATGIAAQGLAEQHRQLAQAREQDRQAQERYAQAVTQTAKVAVSGFVNDLRNGVSAADAFRNALDRIVDSMINTAIETMFAQDALGGLIKQFLGFGGGGIVKGLPFPAAPTMHNGSKTGGVRSMRSGVSPAIFANAPRLHNGLMPDEFGAVLQKGEVVIPRSTVRRGGMGNTTSISNDIKIDVATGLVTANSEDARDLGNRINVAVQAVLVAESRPGGLLKQGR
ncbi:hypothetical protein LPJGGPFB_05644 [Ensifer adhaerens]|uniref:phage tail length tape measure family protein n=1 Tax=Ensifer adhaerens TaxID=106592 RepID=UPI00156905DA|nr:phage tail length tape measure family protein [Ensifer adhaerens]NRP22385.1 hypothetical protein [Ensifer adhaerens]